MSWYAVNAENRTTGFFACLSSFKYTGKPETIKDMLFTSYSSSETLLSHKPHYDQVVELLESAKLCAPYLSEYISDLVTYGNTIPDKFVLPQDRLHCRILPKDKPLYLMTAKEMHWAVALVRSGLEMSFAYGKLCELDELYKTNFPKFLLWILSHRYRLMTIDGDKCFGQTTDMNHTMFSEFAMNTDLNRIVCSLKDVLNDDIFPVITSGFLYWSKIKYNKNVVDTKDQRDFKNVGVISLERDNEYVWFTNIMKQITLLNKYIGE